MTRPGYPVGSGEPVPPPNAPRARELGVGVQPGTGNVIRARLVIVSGADEGVFVYSGTPAAGNPPIFWATSATADPYGNVISSTVGVAGTGTFEAGDTIIDAAGQFTYSGAPALGNLLASIASAAGTDGFGNAYQPGFQSGTTIINSAGLFVYSAAPAAGNLIGSIAKAAGTDGFGNAYSAGFTTYTWSGGSPLVSVQVSGQQITITDSPVSRSIVLGSTFAGLASPNNLFLFPSGSGAVNPVLIEIADPASLTIPETWHNFTLQNSCTAGADINGTSYPPAYTLSAEGNVRLRGVVVAPAAGLASGTTWATIPAAYRPAVNIPVALISNGSHGTLAHVYVRPNGNMQFNSALGATVSMYIDCTLNVAGT